MALILVAVVGVGNSVSSLLQRIQYYAANGHTLGLLHEKLSTEDSPNAGAVLVDVIRGVMVAKDKGIGGQVEPVCSYGFKRPPRRYKMPEAYRLFKEFTS